MLLIHLSFPTYSVNTANTVHFLNQYQHPTSESHAGAPAGPPAGTYPAAAASAPVSRLSCLAGAACRSRH